MTATYARLHDSTVREAFQAWCDTRVDINGWHLPFEPEATTFRYPTGVKITNKELSAVPLTRHEFQGAWNYTVHPEPLK
jgi:hypothetical protein